MYVHVFSLLCLIDTCRKFSWTALSPLSESSISYNYMLSTFCSLWYFLVIFNQVDVSAEFRMLLYVKKKKSNKYSKTNRQKYENYRWGKSIKKYYEMSPLELGLVLPRLVNQNHNGKVQRDLADSRKSFSFFFSYRRLILRVFVKMVWNSTRGLIHQDEVRGISKCIMSSKSGANCGKVSRKRYRYRHTWGRRPLMPETGAM